MFEQLSDAFNSIVRKLRGTNKLTEDNLTEAVSEVRLALLDADVNYQVAKRFIQKVKERALGQKVISSLEPGQLFIKIVYDELVSLMGEEENFSFSHYPTILMLCGLQGSGKTTSSIKLAHYFRKKQLIQKPMVVACDLKRPAAIEQLEQLGATAKIDVFSIKGATDPLFVANKALDQAARAGVDLLIIDTAGRTQLDQAMMEELKELHAKLKPHEVIFVANAASGQEAVQVTRSFHEAVPITGSILTMIDGSARGGAAISIRDVTQRPLLFEGVGEGIEDLQPFNGRSMAERILGMGDRINLVRKAQAHFNEQETQELEKKLRKASFTFDDYLHQMQTIKKMGPLQGLLKMLPGAMRNLPMENAERDFKGMEAIILSMTPAERSCKVELTPSRMIRISKGSGRPKADVQKLATSFKQMKKLFKKMPSEKKMKKMLGGVPWQ